MSDRQQDEIVNRTVTQIVTQILEQPPQVTVPADFAAYVRSVLPALRPARSRSQAGDRVAAAALAVSALALFGLAPHAAPSLSSLQFDLEMLLLAQMAGIGYWLASRRQH